MSGGRHVRIVTDRVTIVYDHDIPTVGLYEARVKWGDRVLPFVGCSSSEREALEWLLASLVGDPIVTGALAEVLGD